MLLHNKQAVSQLLLIQCYIYNCLGGTIVLGKIIPCKFEFWARAGQQSWRWTFLYLSAHLSCLFPSCPSSGSTDCRWASGQIWGINSSSTIKEKSQWSWFCASGTAEWYHKNNWSQSRFHFPPKDLSWELLEGAQCPWNTFWNRLD